MEHEIVIINTDRLVEFLHTSNMACVDISELDEEILDPSLVLVNDTLNQQLFTKNKHAQDRATVIMQGSIVDTKDFYSNHVYNYQYYSMKNIIKLVDDISKYDRIPYINIKTINVDEIHGDGSDQYYILPHVFIEDEDVEIFLSMIYLGFETIKVKYKRDVFNKFTEVYLKNPSIDASYVNIEVRIEKPKKGS